MRTQQDIDRFTLAFHRLALARLRSDAGLITQAVATLKRWQVQRGTTASAPYLLAWQDLLEQGLDSVEREVCVETEKAATLRNTSPLGFVLSAQERMALHHAARA